MNTADRLTFPVGRRATRGWTNYYKATVFLDEWYHNNLGYWHPGEDWNDKQGGNSDDGAPVFCVGNGVVEQIGNYNVWGNVILVCHELPEGRKFWSQYAHLRYVSSELRIGDEVAVDEFLGTIGRGKNNYFKYAHLHFEIRLKQLSADNWTPMVKYKEKVMENYTDPTKWIKGRL